MFSLFYLNALIPPCSSDPADGETLSVFSSGIFPPREPPSFLYYFFSFSPPPLLTLVPSPAGELGQPATLRLFHWARFYFSLLPSLNTVVPPSPLQHCGFSLVHGTRSAPSSALRPCTPRRHSAPLAPVRFAELQSPPWTSGSVLCGRTRSKDMHVCCCCGCLYAADNATRAGRWNALCQYH